MAVTDGYLADTKMALVTLRPNGLIDGEPVWTVVGGQGTMLEDPSHPLWDASLPPKHQMFLVSETLPEDDLGERVTEYLIEADVARGDEIVMIQETLIVHSYNQANSLGLGYSLPVDKPA